MSIFVSGTILRTTDKAVLLDRGHGADVWIPKSIIVAPDADELDIGDEVDLEVQSWFARREGLDDDA